MASLLEKDKMRINKIWCRAQIGDYQPSHHTLLSQPGYVWPVESLAGCISGHEHVQTVYIWPKTRLVENAIGRKPIGHTVQLAEFCLAERQFGKIV